MTNTQRWYFPLFLLVATCFGVFVLPFLLPPPPLTGVSAANVAGFNNKVAALAAAALGTLAGLIALRSPSATREIVGDFGKIPWQLVLVAATLCGGMVALLSYCVATSDQPYGDGRYFLHQISMYVDYGRKLYDQIELPYGPFLFYVPAMVHRLLSPLHVSLAASYYITLVSEHVTGLLLVAYVLNALPIRRQWKIVFFLLCLVHTYPFAFGLNYTFLRFVLPIAFLILTSRQTQPVRAAACIFIGQMMSLSLSPEMGLAFGASTFAYAVYSFFVGQRAWLLAIGAPFAATAAFFLLAGAGYLRMLKLFAHGIANFVVEPLPYILVFLVALVWLAPLMLARFFRGRRPEAPLLAALYVFSVALLPVAFGRADPGHVFFNGFGIYLLSLVAISDAPPRQQWAWMTCVVLILTWTAFIDDRSSWYVLRDQILHRASYQPLDVKALQAIVSHDPVALPVTVPWPIEEALERAGQFVPTFYDREWSILDASAEDRQLAELNAARWALLPVGPIVLYTETQESIAPYLGHRLPYHSPYPIRRQPYVIGRRFAENLAANWRPYARLGAYQLYRRRD